jgi:hypothetical protein
MQARKAGPLGWLRSWAPTEGCRAPAYCKRVRDGFLRNYLDELELCALSPFVALQLGFCAVCAPPSEAAVIAGRKKIWEELPTFFDLPPWNELENDL